MMGSLGLLALAMTVAPVQDVTSFEMFQLLNSCEPMYLLVTVLDDEDMKNVGLTKERRAVRGGEPLAGSAVAQVRHRQCAPPTSERCGYEDCV